MVRLFFGLTRSLWFWIALDAGYLLLLFGVLHFSLETPTRFGVAHGYGVFIGTVVMFTGLGAGVLWLPFFALYGVCPLEAVSLSLCTQILGKASGSFNYLRERMVELPLFRVFLPWALCGVLIGYLAGFVLPHEYERWLLLVFVGVVVYLLGMMIRSLRTTPDNAQCCVLATEEVRCRSLPVVLCSSFFTGLLSIGNSDWLIPYMERRLGVSTSRAVATGILVMFACALFYLGLLAFSVLVGARTWPQRLPLVLATGSGVILGGQIGTRLVRVSLLRARQKHAFIVMLALSAGEMLYKFFRV